MHRKALLLTISLPTPDLTFHGIFSADVIASLARGLAALLLVKKIRQ
jgi:hypothetical protein